MYSLARSALKFSIVWRWSLKALSMVASVTNSNTMKRHPLDSSPKMAIPIPKFCFVMVPVLVWNNKVILGY